MIGEPMDFSQVQPDDCMHTLAADVAEELRQHLRLLYIGMYKRSEELNGAMPNVVLAGVTLLWLEAIQTLFGTADYESAIRLVNGMRPNNDQVTREMRLAARDVLRRSGWLSKRKKK